MLMFGMGLPLKIVHALHALHATSALHAQSWNKGVPDYVDSGSLSACGG
jgi:hypothetical protein